MRIPCANKRTSGPSVNAEVAELKVQVRILEDLVRTLANNLDKVGQWTATIDYRVGQLEESA